MLMLLIFYETLVVFFVSLFCYSLFLYFVFVLLTWYREHGLIRLESVVASAVEFPSVWEWNLSFFYLGL